MELIFTYSEMINICTSALDDLGQSPIAEELPYHLASPEMIITTLDQEKEMAMALLHYLQEHDWPELSSEQKIILAMRLIYTRDTFQRELDEERDCRLGAYHARLCLISTAFDYWRIQGGEWLLWDTGVSEYLGQPSFAVAPPSGPIGDFIAKYIDES